MLVCVCVAVVVRDVQEYISNGEAVQLPHSATLRIVTELILRNVNALKGVTTLLTENYEYLFCMIGSQRKSHGKAYGMHYKRWHAKFESPFRIRSLLRRQRENKRREKRRKHSQSLYSLWAHPCLYHSIQSSKFEKKRNFFCSCCLASDHICFFQFSFWFFYNSFVRCCRNLHAKFKCSFSVAQFGISFYFFLSGNDSVWNRMNFSFFLFSGFGVGIICEPMSTQHLQSFICHWVMDFCNMDKLSVFSRLMTACIIFQAVHFVVSHAQFLRNRRQKQ